MLRIIVPGVINNPDIPLADPEMAMNNEYSLATWGMLDKTDFSGNGNDLSGSLSFNQYGMVTTSNGRMATGLLDASEFTMVFATNTPIPAATGNLVSNLMGGATPFSGFRVAVNSSGTLLVSVGSSSGSANTLSIGTGAGAWTCFAVSVKDTLVNAKRSTGAEYTFPVTGRVRGANQLYINGAPDGSSLLTGVPGTFGMLAYYNKFYTAAECAPLIEEMRTIMRGRGVTI